MKLSLNWIKQYTTVDLSVDELVRKIGAQLGEVDGVENLGPKYEKAVVVKVVSCDGHPNADRLHVCTIDDGGITPDVNRLENGLVQVVCGAPNVKAGVTVVWLPPGATVPESYGKDPIVLEARELRGVVSNGMLASPKELALGESHEGLLLLDDKQPGTMFAEAYGLNDTIIDIENKMFTHRPDLFGELGLAREIAGITGRQFESPDWYSSVHDAGLDRGETLPFEVRNELLGLVPRFMAVALRDITIEPSPVWLQSYLSRMGIRPINNVVDITNYIMLLTAQPLHAYDYDKVASLTDQDGAVLSARNPRDSERLTLLSGKVIDPRQDAIMIATDRQLIGAAGVMGGADTEVDENTKNIILEVATFDMYSVRRTSMAHGLFTDAVTRFNKGQSPLQNLHVMPYALRLLGELAGAKQASDIIDANQLEGREWVHPPVPVTTDFVNARLGLSLSADQMKTLLQNVEFDIDVADDMLTVTSPFWRTDIETREDIVEEIGRLHGFDTLPAELPFRTTAPVSRDELLALKSTIREILCKAGANELLTYSFVHGDLLRKVGQNPQQAFSLTNALSPELQFYRLSLLPSLLDKVHMNIKAGYDTFALFEMGKSHQTDRYDEDGLPLETESLALTYAARKNGDTGTAYYQVRRILDTLADTLGVALEYVPLEAHELPLDAPFAIGRAADIRLQHSGKKIGVIGEYSAAVRRALKLPDHSAGFELQFYALQSDSVVRTYIPLSRYPKIVQDVTLRMPADTPYADVQDALAKTLEAAKASETRILLQPLSVYRQGTADQYKNVSFRLTISNYQKTMTDAEINNLIEKALQELPESPAATRV
jgi:phenylalanyl-tRNA synthetase beta chain